MRFKAILAVTILAIAATVSGCNPPEAPKAAHTVRTHSDKTAVNVRQVRNSDDNSLLYWYIIYSNFGSTSCPCYTASSPTPVSNLSSLSFARTDAVPASAGNSATTKVEQEQTEQEPNESLPQEVQAEVAAEEAAADAAADAAEAAEASADSTDGIGDGPNDTSMSDSGGDSYGGDSGGGDSGGGGDGGGGGGE